MTTDTKAKVVLAVVLVVLLVACLFAARTDKSDSFPSQAVSSMYPQGGGADNA